VIDDSEELERELSWTRPTSEAERRRTRPPRGYTAAIGFSGMYSLAGFALFLQTNSPPESEIGRIVYQLTAMVVVVLVSIKLGFLTWRLIGPVARSFIRPLMFFGPLPLYVLVLFGLGAINLVLHPEELARVVAQSAQRRSGHRQEEPPPEPPKPPPPAPQVKAVVEKVTADQARAACSAFGEGWLPATESEYVLGSNELGNQREADFWVYFPERDPRHSLKIHPVSCLKGVSCRVELSTVRFRADGKAALLCAHPP
jgi:hypothetical protein